uniref:Galectin n=1 Tax=Caenorhabditis japonica TaxID=281687 RepID=A0A8R1DPA2_CAEJA
MLFLGAYLIISVVQSKLIRVNEWQDISIGIHPTEEDALVEFHLFAKCERFSALFTTENSETTKFSFLFYDTTLRKVDIESVEENKVDIPETPEIFGTCREKNRKILRIRMKTSNDTITFKIDDQLVRRPYDSRKESIKVLVPQNVACCLIRALYLSSSDMKEYSSTTPEFNLGTLERNHVSTTTQDALSDTFISTLEKTLTTAATTTSSHISTSSDNNPITSPATFTVTNMWSKFALGKIPAVTNSTLKPETSWTHAVNKQWSITFVLCSIAVCSIMLFLAVFGTFTVFYLMSKPSGGKSPYAVGA